MLYFAFGCILEWHDQSLNYQICKSNVTIYRTKKIFKLNHLPFLDTLDNPGDIKYHTPVLLIMSTFNWCALWFRVSMAGFRGRHSWLQLDIKLVIYLDAHSYLNSLTMKTLSCVHCDLTRLHTRAVIGCLFSYQDTVCSLQQLQRHLRLT